MWKDYEGAMRDDDAQGLGGTESNTTKEVQKIMPKAASTEAKVDPVRARQQRARRALDAAMKRQGIAQKRTDEAIAEMHAARRTDDGITDEHGDAAEPPQAPLVHDVERSGAVGGEIEEEVRGRREQQAHRKTRS